MRCMCSHGRWRAQADVVDWQVATIVLIDEVQLSPLSLPLP